MMKEKLELAKALRRRDDAIRKLWAARGSWVTKAQIARQFGISRERVRQIVESAK
jgi:DNA-directed RNA polymerase sigma subunit (sigma70/sigma32)